MRDANGLVTILEGTIREIVRQEVSSALQTQRGPLPPAGRDHWMTPPAAARQVGISEKAVRNMIRTGAVVPRLRNVHPDPKQPKYLVNVDDVTSASQRHVPRGATEHGTSLSTLAEHALRLRAKGDGR